MIEASAIAQPAGAAGLDRDQHHREPDELQDRHQNAGAEHQRGERIFARRHQFFDAAEDRALEPPIQLYRFAEADAIDVPQFV